MSDDDACLVDEIAQKILFSECLEEKLSSPLLDEVVFSEAGNFSKRLPRSSDFVPGRPEELRFRGKNEGNSPRANLPASSHLVNDQNRGRLLHFFANHELLATELMALALLKFPDAPVEFRKGLYQTMREEQRHTRWYMQRMKECGVEFGSFALSRFFWDCISDMSSPIDYVSRLSLTFEQANLDYSLHYARIMEEAGDSKTASILHKIYKDEIQHVSYGLHWFREWKDSSESDWSALEKRLILPLSLSRAKGGKQTRFNREGRLQAGLDEHFIERLALFERSRGRTPDVWFFNPEAEERIAIWPRALPVDQKVNSIMSDLEILAAALSKNDDVLMMRSIPSESHRKKLQTWGLPLPEMVEVSSTSLSERKLHRVRPWSVAPDLPEQFRELIPQCTQPRKLWQENWQNLFSRGNHLSHFARWMGQAISAGSTEEISEILKEFERDHFEQAVLKTPISAAGRGLRFVPTDGPLFGPSLRWVQKRMPRFDHFLVEPFHPRVFDFSVQFEFDLQSERLLRKGMVRQIIDKRGQFRGSVVARKFCQGLPAGLSQFLMNEALPQYKENSALSRALAEFCVQLQYSGPLGIDSYVWEDPSTKQLQHRVICEINPRYTMGRVALELQKKVSPDRNLKLEIERVKDRQPHHKNETDSLEGDSFILNEIGPQTRFIASVSIATSVSEL